MFCFVLDTISVQVVALASCFPPPVFHSPSHIATSPSVMYGFFQWYIICVAPIFPNLMPHLPSREMLTTRDNYANLKVYMGGGGNFGAHLHLLKQAPFSQLDILNSVIITENARC